MSNTENKSKIEKIKARIRALAAKTVENGATEAEAIAAFNKVGELLVEYNLEATDVLIEQETYISRNIKTGSKHVDAVCRLSVNIGNFTNTKAFIRRTPAGIEIHFFGVDTDVEAALYLCDVIQKAFITSYNTFRLSREYIVNVHRRRATTDFMNGYVVRMNARLRDLTTINSRITTNAGNSLMVVKNALVEKKFAEQMNIKLTHKNPKHTVYDGSAYEAGKIAANNTDIGKKNATLDNRLSVIFS